MIDTRRIARAPGIARLAPECAADLHLATFGFKETNGTPTRTPAIKFYVSAKKSLGDLAQAQRIPASVLVDADAGVENIPTDICELDGNFSALGVRAGNIVKASDGESGVCALSFDNAQGKFLLTNAHVVYDVDDQSKPDGPVRLRSPEDGKFYAVGKAIGGGAFSDNVATADFAIVRLNPGIDVDEFFILGTEQPLTRNRFEYFGSLSSREYFYNVGGRWFQCGFPEKTVRDVTVTVDGVPIAYRGAWALRMASGSVARKGHSGALILRRGQNGKPWGSGLLFAGNDTGDTILAYPMEGAMRRVERLVGAIS